MNRTRAIEENAFACGFNGAPGEIHCEHPEIHSAMATSFTFFQEPEKFVLLSLYEQRIHRNFHRNMKLFKELKKERESNLTAEAPVEAAKPLTMTATAAAPEAPVSAAESAPPI